MEQTEHDLSEDASLLSSRF